MQRELATEWRMFEWHRAVSEWQDGIFFSFLHWTLNSTHIDLYK